MSTERCRTLEQDYPSVHTCEDPLICAVDALIAGPDPRTVELERLHDLLDVIEEEVRSSKSKLAARILQVIHTERGGSR
jgi:hypothetical protein